MCAHITEEQGREVEVRVQFLFVVINWALPDDDLTVRMRSLIVCDDTNHIQKTESMCQIMMIKVGRSRV